MQSLKEQMAAETPQINEWKSQLLTQSQLIATGTAVSVQLDDLSAVMQQLRMANAEVPIDALVPFLSLNGDTDIQSQACHLVQLQLNRVSAKDILSQYSDLLSRALSSGAVSVKLLVLNQLMRMKGDDVQLIAESTLFPDLLLNCLADDCIQVYNTVCKVMTLIASSADGAHTLCQSSTVDCINTLTQRNSIVKMRVYECLAQLTVRSADILEAYKDSVLKGIVETLNSNDVLEMVNILDTASILIRHESGFKYLEQCGFLTRLETILKSIDAETVSLDMTLSIPYAAQCVGIIYASQSSSIDRLELQYHFLKTLVQIAQSEVAAYRESAIASFGHIGSSDIGLQKVWATSGAATSIAKTFRAGTTSQSLLVLSALTQIMETGSESPLNSHSERCHTLFDVLNIAPQTTITFLIKTAKSAFTDNASTTFNFMHAVCGHEWGLRLFCNTSSFVQFLFDRSSLSGHTAVMEKFDLISYIDKNLKSYPGTVTSDFFNRVHEYVAQGAYYKKHETQVALEMQF